MEARSYKFNKVDKATDSKKLKAQLILERKPLIKNNLRSLKKPPLPPLTPLHRLRRFKATRDKNLRRKVTQMEDKATEKVSFTEELMEIDSLKAKKVDKLEKINGKEENKIANGTDISNGHESDHNDLDNASLILKAPELNGVKKHNDQGSTSSVSKESGINEINKDENISSVPNDNIGEQSETNFSKDNDSKSSKSEPLDNDLLTDNCLAEKEPSEENLDAGENDGGSICSSSSYSSSKRRIVSSSSEDISEPAPIPNENSEEEIEIEDDYDRLSNMHHKNNKDKGEYSISTGEHHSCPEEMKLSHLPIQIPGSVSSASSYKSAYSCSRPKMISGRRPVRGYCTLGSSRKRKASEFEENYSNSVGSPSELSPRWKFFPSSFSNLWSPHTTPFVFSESATPLRNVDDSMAVNVDDDTINYHLNDSELFSEANESPNKRARWGCNIM